MTTGDRGINLIKGFESLHDGDLTTIGLQPKMCPAGVWTEGFGHAILDPLTGDFVEGAENYERALECSFINDPNIDDELEAEALLAEDLKGVEAFLDDTGVILDQNQYDALVSFIFNLGRGAFTTNNSTLRRLLSVNPNARRSVLINERHLIHYFNRHDFQIIHYNFVRWCKCLGEPLKGLIRRRDAEYKLYIGEH